MATPLPDPWDEAYASPGHPRAEYADVLGALAELDLPECAERMTADLRERGVWIGVPDFFRLDPVPRLLRAAEWAHVERGALQRVRALEAFVADAHGARRIVDAGRVPARVIDRSPLYEPDLTGAPVPAGGAIALAGLDLARGPDGRFRVLEDNLRTPTGWYYAGVAREVGDARLELPATGRRPLLDPAYDALADALRGAAPDGRGDPSIVLLSDGPANSAWFEQKEIARRLAIPLVALEDLKAGGPSGLRARVEGQPRPVDVLYRRTDEDRLRDARGRPTALARLVLGPLRRGTLACVNAFGAGVADDKLAHVYVEEMVRFYLGEEPILPSVVGWDLAEPAARAEVLERLGELVVKPRVEAGGTGVLIGPHASAEQLEHAARAIRTDPENWIAQETIVLSRHPTFTPDGLRPRHVDLRPLVTGGTVVDGALTRAAVDGSMVVNLSRGGAAKDTWLVR